MSRRGLTLIELLCALALLGALAAVLASWTMTAARLSATHGPMLQWHSAAQRLLELLGDDLVCGDFEPIRTRQRSGDPRIEVLDGPRLRLEARAAPAHGASFLGPSIHEYALDRASGTLTLTIRPRHDPSALPVKRFLLADVADWECIVDEDEEDRTLTVTITRRGGSGTPTPHTGRGDPQTATRRYALP
jgi:prepilin-type N-terminal cleavage/methylation domain-containing protein